MAKTWVLNLSECTLWRGREVGNLLMHVSIPSTHVSSMSSGFLYFSLFFFVYSVFFTFFLSLCFLFSVVPFFTNHNYSLLYCLPWQDLPFLPFNHFWLVVGILLDWPLACRMPTPPPPHTMLAAPCLILSQNGFVLSPTSLHTLIQIRVKPFHYHPLWHVSSDSNSCLLLLDEMSF